MAARKLKPIEERDPYAAAILGAYDELHEQGNTPPRPATASQQHARGNPSSELKAEIGAGDCTGVAVQLVAHDCPREGLMEVEAGAPCNWCGEVVAAALPPVIRGGRP